ncbi:hypothetical protein C5167_026664 [Papaver somniferum]|nr:hypothetical protein C5167_026664 [Papaver somniferum]
MSPIDVAAAGVISAYCAVKTWRNYYFTSNALHKIREAPNVNGCDLRQLVEKEVENSNGTGGKLFVVKGIVEAGWRNIRPTALVSSEAAGGTAVMIENTQKAPFVLLDIGRSLNPDYLFVNMDGSKHPLHVSTVFHELQPVQASPSTKVAMGWRRWKELKQQWRAKAANVAEAIAAVAVTAAAGLAIAVIATEFEADEIEGLVPDSELCAICLSRRRGERTLFGPCGHILSCQICAPSAVEQQSSPRARILAVGPSMEH